MALLIGLNIGAGCWLGHWRAMCLQQVLLHLEAGLGFTGAASEGKPHVFLVVQWAKAKDIAKPRVGVGEVS